MAIAAILPAVATALTVAVQAWQRLSVAREETVRTSQHRASLGAENAHTKVVLGYAPAIDEALKALGSLKPSLEGVNTNVTKARTQDDVIQDVVTRLEGSKVDIDQLGQHALNVINGVQAIEKGVVNHFTVNGKTPAFVVMFSRSVNVLSTGKAALQGAGVKISDTQQEFANAD